MSDEYIYDYIPTLKELMPTTAGIPGVEYAQVSTPNIRMAQDLGWGRICGNQKVYTITGPKGSVDCELYCKGTPIMGEAPTGGKRVCMVDKDIRSITGLGRETAPEPAEVDDTPVRQAVYLDQNGKKGSVPAILEVEKAPVIEEMELEPDVVAPPKRKAGRPKGSGKKKVTKKMGTQESVPGDA